MGVFSLLGLISIRKYLKEETVMKKGSWIILGVVLAVSVSLGTACTKKPGADTGGDVTSRAVVVSSAPEESLTEESEPGSETEVQKEAYHMLQGTVTKAPGEGEAFTLRADDGKDYEIGLSDIRYVEVELEKDVQVAIAYIGEPLGDLKDVTLVVALPEQEEWSIFTEQGVTISNGMSSFSMKTEDGRALSFLKDNCPIEEGALAEDSGEKVSVVYVNSQGANYPIEIKKADTL